MNSCNNNESEIEKQEAKFLTIKKKEVSQDISEKNAKRRLVIWTISAVVFLLLSIALAMFGIKSGTTSHRPPTKINLSEGKKTEKGYLLIGIRVENEEKELPSLFKKIKKNFPGRIDYCNYIRG